MIPHLASSSALSLLKKSDLETFVFELLDFVCINFLEGQGGGKEGLNMLGAKLHFKGLFKDNFFLFEGPDHRWL